MRGNSCHVERHLRQWKGFRRKQAPGGEESPRSLGCLRCRWLSSKWRGGVSQGWASRLLTEIKPQETLKGASERAAVSGRLTRLPWLLWVMGP